MAQGKKIIFIYNPHSGMIHPVNFIRRLIDRYFPSNLCDYEFLVTERKGHAKQIAKKAVALGYDIVVAIGGDGTVHEVASELVGTDVWFGIVPLGSGNGFARGLGIPMSIRQAIRLITYGNIRKIDVGRANEYYFFTTSGFGFDAILGQRFNKGKTRGPVPYYVAGVREYFFYKQPEFTIIFDGVSRQYRALLVAVANVRQYGNNAIIAPEAVPDDGLLDLCIIRSIKFFQTIMQLPKLFTGHIQKSPYVEMYQGKYFEIIRSTPDIYCLDGEVYKAARKKISVSVLPQALNVIVNDLTY